MPDNVLPRPVTVITGASSGIGRELARLAARHDEVLLIARDRNNLEALAAEIGALGGTAHVLVCDLTLPGAVGAVTACLANHGLHCERLVNNAGFGLVGEAHALDADEQLASIDLNVRCLTALTLAMLPAMIARRSGGILNVASVAAFLPGSGMAVYYATKAYVQSFSEGLWAEVRPHGVIVTSLCPGPVNTGFLARATGGKRHAEATFLHLNAARVAEEGWSGFLKGHLTVIPGRSNRWIIAITRFVPRQWLALLVHRHQSGRTAAATSAAAPAAARS